MAETRTEAHPAEQAPAAVPAPEAEAPTAEQQRIGELEAELTELRERWMRARADLENVRKRAARDADREIAAHRERMLLHWLEAIDSMERAIGMQADASIAEGLRSVLEQMDAVLAREGVMRIAAVGEPFDPERHDAVAVRPSDEVADRTVLDVARSGYTVGDRVLRPAQVVVSRAVATGGAR